MPDDKFLIEIPKKIVHRKEEDLKTSSTGAKFAWIDVSEVLGLKNYGFYFPDWLISEKLEKCTLTIQQCYFSKGSTKENIFIIERKDKVKGKRFKQYKYTAPELAELLQNGYADKLRQIKEIEENNLAFAYVLEAVSQIETRGFYCIGYIKGKMFYSDEIERFRENNVTRNAGGGKQINAKSCNIIAEHLSKKEVAQLIQIMKALDMTRAEKAGLKSGVKPLPSPYGSGLKDWYADPENDYITHVFNKARSPRYEIDHYTINGYFEKLEAMEKAYTEALDFLEEKEKELTETLENWGKDRKDCEQ